MNLRFAKFYGYWTQLSTTDVGRHEINVWENYLKVMPLLESSKSLNDKIVYILILFLTEFEYWFSKQIFVSHIKCGKYLDLIQFYSWIKD